MTVSRLNNMLFAAGAMLVAAAVFAGCSKRPSEVLSEKEMVSLMVDMQLAEAYSDMEYNTSHDTDKRKELAESVLAQHKVSREQLDTTLAWYGRNIDDYSDLFKKVDDELKSRKRAALNLGKEEEIVVANMLWPYGKNGIISQFGNSDAWVFSVPEPGLNKGDMLEWRMHVNGGSSLSGVLGVDYEDGTSEAVTSVFSGRPSLLLKLQTDTGKNVKRIYGTMRLKNKKDMPLIADSISLIKLAFDSLEFSKYRNQKKYGIPVKKVVVKREKADSLASNLVDDSVLRDSVAAEDEQLPNTRRVTGPDPNAPIKMLKLNRDGDSEKNLKRRRESPSKPPIRKRPEKLRHNKGS